MACKKNLQELFHENPKILSTLPKTAKAARSQKLKAALQKHETETEAQVARLEKVFEELDEAPRGACDASITIEKGQEIMKGFKGALTLDADLLAAADAVEHYEIARYGTLKTWAAEIGMNQAIKLLEASFAEEKKTDQTLTKLAESARAVGVRAAFSRRARRVDAGRHSRPLSQG
jgi:ferritin-like metal-binding protein YciE